MTERSRLRDLFRGKKPCILEPAQLTESTQPLLCPRTGWYRIFPFRLEQDWDPEELRWCLNDQEQLVLVRADIGAFRSRELSEEALRNLRRILSFFRERGKEIILRVVYDSDGKGIEHEPNRLERIQGHILQLAPVLGDYADGIFVFQGALIGSWGEMHTSRFLTPDRLCSLLTLLEKELDSRIYLAVRKPSQYRLFRQMADAETRLGLFNDGLFGSESDLGTYGTLPAQEAGWSSAWLPAEELDFQEILCRGVPQGGEAVMPAGELYSLEETAAKLSKMHVSYLNSTHDPALLKAWADQVWQSNDAWNGMNGFDYIGRHLGYRFVADSVSFDGKILNITIKNVGFAPIYEQTELVLTQKWEDGRTEAAVVSADLTRLTQGEGRTFSLALQPEKSELFLSMRRSRDGKTIPLGNVTTEDGVLLGRLR